MVTVKAWSIPGEVEKVRATEGRIPATEQARRNVWHFSGGLVLGTTERLEKGRSLWCSATSLALE